MGRLGSILLAPTVSRVSAHTSRLVPRVDIHSPAQSLSAPPPLHFSPTKPSPPATGAMDPAAAVAGMDELVEEVLLRSPPDDPAHLVHAALVCRRWCRIVTGPGFRRRFRERHRSPPMLGGFHRPFLNVPDSGAPCGFAPTASFRPRNADLGGRYALDSRHGRVLVGVLPSVGGAPEARLAVWDPVTGEQLELPEPPLERDGPLLSWNAAVLCASSKDGACDHLDCSRGQFLVVVVVTTILSRFAYVYSSDDGEWSQRACALEFFCPRR
nr:unnamed protein product [Digitaria exilis]